MTNDQIIPSGFKPLSLKDLNNILGLTIKEDNENKLITFLCALSAYTEKAQFNISFNAPSSSGKSFIPTEIAKLFPQEDVKTAGYCSPTAFFHDDGIYDKENNSITIDFSNKILIFLDQPHNQLLERLRPILSHDADKIVAKITDKSDKGGHRTKNLIIKGFPAVMFCSAGQYIDEQESTRFILLSPEINQTKLRKAAEERIIKDSDAQFYNNELDNNPERVELKKRIQAIKSEHIKDVKIPDNKKVFALFLNSRPTLKPRHLRDVGRLMSIIKVLALLNCWFRERRGDIVIANDDDIQQALNIWNKVSESQEYNLSPHIFDIYKFVILPLYRERGQGVTRQEIINKHFEVNGTSLQDFKLRQQILPLLEGAGLVTQEQDLKDKRKVLITATNLLIN